MPTPAAEKQPLVFGFYIAPYVWIGARLSEVPTPEYSRKIAFSRQLDNGLQIFVQYQGMVVAALPPDLVPGGERPRRVSNVLHADTQRWVLNLFNAFRFALDNAECRAGSYAQPQAVLPEDLFVFSHPNDLPADAPYVATTQAAPIMDQANIFRDQRREVLKLELGHGSLRDVHFRLPLSDTTLKNACDLLNHVVPDFNRNTELLALLNESAFLIKQADFHRSLITSWAVCEHLIDREWERYVDSTNEPVSGHAKPKTLNRKRREKLLYGSDWTASLKLEALELSKRLPFALFDDLMTVRATRNAWMHELQPVGNDMAGQCLRSAITLMARKLGLSLEHRGASYMDAAAYNRLTGS